MPEGKKMKTFFLAILTCSLSVAFPPSFNRNLSLATAPLQKSLPHDESTKELRARIELELDQIAKDMDVIDAGMMQAVAERSSTEKSSVKAHELLRDCKPGQMIQDFFNSSSGDLRWALCLKSGKLYMSLLDLIFEYNQNSLLNPGKSGLQSSVADAYSEVAQLSFLARMMTEFELRLSQLTLQGMTSSDENQPQRWRLLHSSLLKDDQSYLDQLKTLLAATGISPGQFAANVIQDARKTSLTAASSVLEGMNAIDPQEKMWRFAEIPGVNPDFLQAMSCDNAKMNEFISARSLVLLIQACNCRYRQDGSLLQAFDAKPVNLVKPPDLAETTEPLAAKTPAVPQTLRLPEDRSILDQLNPDRTYPQTETEPRQEENKGEASERPTRRCPNKKSLQVGSGVNVRMIIRMPEWSSMEFAGTLPYFTVLIRN